MKRRKRDENIPEACNPLGRETPAHWRSWLHLLSTICMEGENNNSDYDDYDDDDDDYDAKRTYAAPPTTPTGR